MHTTWLCEWTETEMDTHRTNMDFLEDQAQSPLFQAVMLHHLTQTLIKFYLENSWSIGGRTVSPVLL